MSSREPDQFNGPFMQRRWADRHKMRTLERPSDLGHPIEALIDSRKTLLVEAARKLDRWFLDHASFYSTPGSRSASALVAAPYLGAVAREGHTVSSLNDLAHRTARDFGLFVRVAHPSDTIHLSRWPREPTVPVVFWNPERVVLHLDPPEDPYPTVAAEE